MKVVILWHRTPPQIGVEIGHIRATLSVDKAMQLWAGIGYAVEQITGAAPEQYNHERSQ